MKGYRARCAAAPFLKAIEALCELLVPVVMADIIDFGIKNADKPYILGRIALLGFLAVLGLCFTMAAQYFAASTAVGFTSNIKKALYRHITSLEYGDIDREGTSALLSKMTNDTREIQNGVNLTLRLISRSVLIVFGAAVMAFVVDAKSGLIFAVVIPVLFVVVFSIMLFSVPIYKKIQKRLESVVTSVREYLYGVRLVRSFGRDGAEAKRFDERNGALEKSSVFAGKISSLMNPLTLVIINLGVVALLYSGTVRVSAGTLTAGQVVALYNYMSQILIELLKLANLVMSISRALSAASRIEGVLESGARGESGAIKEPQKEILKTSRAVELENVSFSYDADGAPALSGVSLSVESGETVGIIGQTGSGKTTLVNLISGFYKPSGGKVKIYGRDISEYDKNALRKAFHHVPQKSVLFSGTLRDNLLWGNEAASDDELSRALESAVAMDFVEKKDGLDTWVGEEGAGFSGGQRQRLCVARALVGSPDFLILDDSASALDLATEKKLRGEIAAIEPHPTTFIISQRASSIMHADKILVMENGRRVGLGTHAELLSSCGVYREIFASQFGEESLPPRGGLGENISEPNSESDIKSDVKSEGKGGAA